MDKKKRRVNFRISHCSSEDPDYPVSELLLQSPNSKGWQSKRFCQYPQTIVYQLVEPTIVQQISVLSHQSKISTRLVIHNKLQQDKDWTRLGYLSLESNVNSNYQARQLKTVNINLKPSLFLRFSFEANYVNNHNIFNQVSVISLCVFGDSMIGSEDPEKQLKALQGQFDKNTLAKLKSLEMEKTNAINDENYDRAKEIKDKIQKIKKLGSTIMLLEEKKRKAVADEDYEAAKIINQKIKSLRDSEGGGPNFSARPSGTPTDYYRQKKPIFEEPQQEPSVSPMTYQKPIQQQRQPQQRAPERRSPPRHQKNQLDGDERPINVKNQNPYETAGDDEQEYENNEPGGVQPLSKQIREECMQYFHILDEQIFMYLFSTHHANRERGINLTKDEIMGGNKNKQQTTEAFLYVVKKLIDDKNVAVLLATIELFGMGMKKLRPPNGNPFLQMAQFILERLNDYLGHSNEKVRAVTEDVYSSIPKYPLTNKDVCYSILSILGKRDKPPKILTGRFKMLSTIVQNFQLGKNYETTINFAVKYADDKNGDVRNAAINLICTISNEIGYGSMQPYLKNIRPQIIKTIEERVNNQGINDNRGFDEKPIRGGKKAQKIEIRNNRQEFLQAQNQFIQMARPKNVPNPQYVCEFCGRFDKKFENEDYRDLHLYNACPMLMICEECSQAIQISTYTSHQIGQCKNSKYFKRCPRCKEAVHQKQYKAHVERKECIPAKPLAVANRCPLCHLDIDSGAEGWKKHLSEQGCENNPRK